MRRCYEDRGCKERGLLLRCKARGGYGAGAPVQGEKAATLGALLHNPQLVEELEAKGVKVVDAPGDTPEGHVLVLRSHGVTLEVEREIERLGLRFADATCPFVKKKSTT